ncbi:uncharacterized protein [Amphiura filiformis]|uniref:uncharacterized protein n=1 Tax=Amphiura filiformis TaxID=82378 RepID=UPI003B2184B3
MEYNCEPFSKFSYIFASIMKYNLIPALLSVLVGGSPWLVAESLSIDVEVVGEYGYSGLVVITFQNASKVTHKGYLCDDESWNINTGEVLCKHSGHIGVEEILYNAEKKYGMRQSDSYLYLRGLSCEGDEESLTECSYKSWSKQGCAALAGVLCNPKYRHHSFFGSFLGRIVVSMTFVPVCMLLCVLCRYCHRRRSNTDASNLTRHASSEIGLDSFATTVSADLPSYDHIIKDKTFKKVSIASGNSNEGMIEPPPAYQAPVRKISTCVPLI